MKLIGDKGVYSNQDLKAIERQLRDTDIEEDLFDQAETNQGITFSNNFIGYQDDLNFIEKDLQELRKNTNEKDLIPDDFIRSALNVYIEHALIETKNNNLIDVRGFNTLNEDYDDQVTNASSHLERRLRDQSMGEHSKSYSGVSNGISLDQGLYGSDENNMRNKELLDLAHQGKLFNIDMDNVYSSVGKTQVKNFERMYAVNQKH